jgi:hypothetical protein
MDIGTQTEIILREAGFETWPWSGGVVPVTCFEDAAVAGFVHLFGSAQDLLARWEQAQYATLNRHSVPLRSAGAKAWNVYTIFLAEGGTPEIARHIERIEEDFSMARKIARGDIRSVDDLRAALLPLLPIQGQPSLGESHYSERLRSRLRELPPAVVEAFIGPASAADVAHMLETDT